MCIMGLFTVALGALGAVAVVAVREVEISGLIRTDFPNVCCLEDDDTPFDIYDPTTSAAQRALGKCLLTTFIPKQCGGSDACKETCKAAMEANSRYYEIKQKGSTKELEKARAEAAKKDALDAKTLQKSQKDADDVHGRAIKDAETRLTAAQKSADAKSAVFDKAKATFEKAKADMEHAEQEKKDAEASLESSKEERKHSEEKANDAKDAAYKQAESALEAAKAERAREVKAKEDAVGTLASDVSSHTTQAAKEGCEGGDCCCSVNNVPVVVDSKTFLDWDECKGAKPYKKPTFSLGCNYFADCSICRNLLCTNKHGGTGACP